MSLLVPTIALAAALAACGDGGPTKSSFIAKADGACAGGNTAISGVAKPTSAPQVTTAAGAAVTALDGQVVALRAMEAPGGKDRAQIDGVIAAIAEVSAPTKALQEAAGKSDDAAMARAAGEMQAKVDTAASSAQAYGLAQCGTGLKPAVTGLFDGAKSVVRTSYVAKGEAACRESQRKSSALTQPGSSLTSVARYLDAYLPILAKFLTDFKAIPVAPGDEATVGEFVTAIEAATPKLKEASAAARANNARLAGALFEELDVSSTQINAKLDAYGLKACGSLGGF